MKQKNMVLMVVAVGCGLVAAFLTSQMSGRTTQTEQVEVIVAAKDLPVGTQLQKDDLPKIIKRKKMPKDGLPPAYVMDENELLEKRLSRPIRAEETFNPADLIKGGVVTIPTGMQMHTLQLAAPQAVAGFVGPGSKVDVLVTVRLGSKLRALPLLVDMLILAVDQNTAYSQNGTFPQLNSVSFAVTRKQALLLELAKARGCTVSLLLRHPDDISKDPDGYSIEQVTKLLSDDQTPTTLKDPEGGSIEDGSVKPVQVAKVETPTKVEPPLPAPVEKPKVVMVPAAKEDIPAGTQLTKDLIADKFELVELPPAQAKFAFDDLTPILGKVFRTGLGKGQWVTESLVGVAPYKPAPQDEQAIEKPAPVEPKTVTQGPTTVTPKAAPPKRKTWDQTITTASGSKTYRYEEVKPGEWKLLGELRGRADSETETTPRTPEKVD